MPQVNSIFRMPLGQAARTISRRLQSTYQRNRHVILPMLLAPIGMGLGVPVGGGPGKNSNSVESLKVWVTHERGVHSYPSGMLVQAISGFKSAVFFISQDGERSEIKNEMDILVLALGKGSRFTIEAQGPDAAEAVAALARMLVEELKIASVNEVTTDRQNGLTGRSVTDQVVIGRALPLRDVLDINAYPVVDLKAAAEKDGRSVEEVLRERMDLVFEAFREIEEELERDGSDVAQRLNVLVMGLKTATLEHMEQGVVCARVAVERALERFVVLRDSSDEKMHSLYADMCQISAKMLSIKHKRAIDIGREIDRLGRDDIVIVAKDMSPADVGLVNDERVRGIVRMNGSRMDHLSIRLGEREKAGLVNVKEAIDSVRSGARVIVDGLTGKLIVNPSASTLRRYREQIRRTQALADDLKTLRQTPARMLDGDQVRLLGNAANPEEIGLLLGHGLEGVGLVRTEFFFIYDRSNLERRSEPGVAEQIEYYNQLISTSHGSEIVFRTIDPDKDKTFPYFTLPNGGVPGSDNKGLALCLDRENFGPYHYAFRNQLKALLQTRGRIKVMFPLVRSTEEFNRAMELVENVKRELSSSGLKVNNEVRFGIMVEHPDVLKHLKELGADGRLTFFSLGTNDLTQYITGVSRYSSVASQYYDALDPRVIQAIRSTVKAAEANAVQLSLCGSMGDDWRSLLVLLGLGLRRISFSPSSSDLARLLITNVDAAGLQLMVRNIAGITTASEIRNYIDEFVRERIRDGSWAGLAAYESLLFSRG